MANLYRSSDEKVIAGVCAGLAHKLGLNMTGLRWLVTFVRTLRAMRSAISLNRWAWMESTATMHLTM